MPVSEVIEGDARPRSTCERKGFEIPAPVAVSSRVRFSRSRSERILLPSVEAGFDISFVAVSMT